MTDSFMAGIKADIAVVASEGQRVIALAQRILPAAEYPAEYTFHTEPTPNYPLDCLTFVACLAVSTLPLLLILSPLFSQHYFPPFLKIVVPLLSILR